MGSRLGRALRGLVLLCLGFAALPAVAQVRHEGAIPDGRGGVGIITTGIDHSCALRQDGSASCWGYESYGKTQPPGGAFMELSAGFEHTCGLRGDGTVECWGMGYTSDEVEPPPPPASMTGRFTALASGVGTTCGLRARAEPWMYPEGNVSCWSANGWGMPLPPPPPGDFAALSVGDTFACGLRADGRAECWGDIDTSAMPQDSFVAISAGARHACGLNADGSARCWGENAEGQATAPAELFTAISAGAFNTCGIRTDNTVQCWGANWAGQSTPPQDDNARFIAISAAIHHACGVRIDGQVACWGNVAWGNSYGFPPRPYEGVFGFGELALGDWHQCQVLADGRLSCWLGMPNDPAYPQSRFTTASSGWDSLCARNATGRLECFGGNTLIQENLPFEPLRQFEIGYEHGCGVLAIDGRAQCWGRETNGKTLAPEGLFRDLSAGLMHSCGVRADGTGKCWGYDGDGQTNVPVLPIDQRFLSIKAGERHSCGLDSALHIKCWGMSPPPAAPAEPYEPQYHPDFATFRALSVGGYHSCAIRTDGRLLCWGENWSGQLDAPEGTFVSVSAGRDFTCAIRSDGRRECWGAPWVAPRLSLDPGTLPGARPGEWLSVHFDLRSESPYQIQEPRYSIVAGTLPPGIRLDEYGGLYGTWHEAARFPITVEGRDRNGFAVRRDYVIAFDDTPPVIEPVLTGTQGENGWHVSPVDVQWSVTDDGSEIRWSGGCEPAQVQNETADARFLCHAESAGGPAFKELQVKVDLMPPHVWLQSFDSQGALARFEFEGHDPMSGVAGFECSIDGEAFAACASPFVRTFAPGERELQIRAVDAAGHRSVPFVHRWFVDATPPQVFADVTGAQGMNDWYIGDVRIQWLPRDDESPITSAVGCETTLLTSDALEAGFTCTATSSGGSTEQTVHIRRDTIAPDTRLTATPAAVINTGSATFEFDGSDATSGVAGFECRFDSSYQWQPCSSPKRYDNLAHGQHVFYVRAIDAAGHRDELEAGYVFKVDTTPPQIIAGQSAQWGSNGWAIGDVQVSFAIHEPESSYTSTQGCEPFVQSTDTAGNSISCSASSVGGTSSNTVVVRRDTVAPEASFTAVPSNGSASTASFAFAGSDATSGVAGFECSLDGGPYVTCASPRVVEAGTGTHSFAVRARDNAGHADASAAVHTWTVDTTAPAIAPTVTGTLGNNGWYVGAVGISWSVQDPESGLVSSTGCNTVSLTSDTAGASVTCTATNAVGATSSRTVSVKIDRTAPVLAPSVAAEMLLNASNSATANGSDTLSGIATATCAALATGTVGSKTVTCSATDQAGNVATANAGYRVVYGFNGFSSPVQNPSVLNVLKAGRSVPLRWRVVDADGAPVSNLGSAGVSAVAIGCPAATENRIGVFGGSNGQLQNLGNGYYQLDWMASVSLRNACRRLELNLGDGLVRPALFKFN